MIKVSPLMPIRVRRPFRISKAEGSFLTDLEGRLQVQLLNILGHYSFFFRKAGKSCDLPI